MGTSSILKGLVNTMGINSMVNTNDFYYVPDIIESRRLKKNIINKVWNSEIHGKNINLISYWEILIKIEIIFFQLDKFYFQ